MIKKLIQEGFILKSKGYYKHAIEYFYKALEIDNSSSELLLEIAECYYLMKDEERALNYIEQILDKNPTHIGSLKLLKEIFINKHAWIEAEQTAKNIYCISTEPKDLAEIFRLLNKQGRYSEIFEYNTDVISPSILYEKAFAKMLLNDLSEAEKYINQALDLQCDDKTLLLKGKILFAMNRKDECVEILNKINIDETNADVLNFAGLIKQYECDFKTALKYFQNAVKIEPSKAEYYYNCASTYFKMGEIQNSKKFYNLAISIAPENQNYHFALANLYYSEKQYKRAMEELDYDFFEAKLLKSVILYESGYFAIAKKEFDKLAVEAPENELIQSYKSRIEKALRI